MTVRVKTDPLSTTYTTEQYALGSRYTQPADENIAANSTHYGEKTWVFVYNDEASTAWAEGDVIFLDSDYAAYNGILATTTLHVHRVLGVAGHAIAAGSYGWIVVKGICEVGAVSTVAQGDRLVSAASANATTLTLNADATSDNLECVFGMALEANGGSTGDKITAIISMPVW